MCLLLRNARLPGAILARHLLGTLPALLLWRGRGIRVNANISGRNLFALRALAALLFLLIGDAFLFELPVEVHPLSRRFIRAPFSAHGQCQRFG